MSGLTMRTPLSVILAAALCVAAPAAWAGPHMHMVEAVAEPGFDKGVGVWIAPVDARQAADPNFRLISTKVAEALVENGFKLAPVLTTRYAVTVDYSAGPSGMGMQQAVSINDPSYRVAIVTAYDVSDVQKPKMMWQTVMDEYGISSDVRSTVPALVQASGRYFGVQKTARGPRLASWCAGNVPLVGTHIAAVCSRNPDRPYIHLAGLLVGMTLHTSTEPGQPPGPGGG